MKITKKAGGTDHELIGMGISNGGYWSYHKTNYATKRFVSVRTGGQDMIDRIVQRPDNFSFRTGQTTFPAKSFMRSRRARKGASGARQACIHRCMRNLYERHRSAKRNEAIGRLVESLPEPRLFRRRSSAQSDVFDSGRRL